MASPATIGALRAVLGMDSAAFESSIKRTRKQTKSFGDDMKRAGAKIGVALTAAAAGLGVALQSAINDMDKLAKTSRQIGVPVEELSRLQHAAELSGVSFGKLETGLARLNKSITEAGQGLSTPIRGFKALNLEFRNADGSLRTVSEMLPEIADRFKNMRDGPEKTALAMQLLGRAGREMIPLLNGGAEGIAKMNAEADALGLTIDQNTAVAAENFNDNMTRLKRAGSGLVNQLAGRVLPTLVSLSEMFLDSAKGSSTLTVTVDGLVLAFKGLVSAGVIMKSIFDAVFDTVRAVAGAVGNLLVGNFAKAGEAISGLTISTANAAETLDGLWKQADESAKRTAATHSGVVVPVIESGTKKLTKSQKELNAARQEGIRITEAMRTPAEQQAADMARLDDLLRKNAITIETHRRAMAKTTQANREQWADLATGVAGDLEFVADTFGKENRKMATAAKAFAIVQALINTYQGITRTLATIPWPFSIVAAGAQAAMGFAQVARIRGQSIPAAAQGGQFRVTGNAGMDNNLVAMRLSRGEGVSVTKVGETDQAAGGGGIQKINIEAVNPRAIFSGETINMLIRELQIRQRDGLKLVQAT